MMAQQIQQFRRGREKRTDGTAENTGATEGEDRSSRGTGAATGLSKNQAFDVLRNSRRRAVISCLRAQGGTMSVDALSTRVAAEEYDVPVDELSSEQYKRVYTGLYQCHLCRMDDLGVLDFDRDDNTVHLRDAASQLEPYLDDGGSPKYARIELGVASAVALVVALGVVGVGPLGAVSQTALAVLTVVALLGLALLQLFEPDNSWSYT